MTDTESARSFLGSDFEKYRQTLNNAIHSDEEYLNAINKYVLGSRGKEIRPILSLLAGLACGKLTEQNYCCAAATEMLHTATLMHDDVADYASMRRGILSVSAMFSAPAAVLTGDFWLARSLNLLVDRCDKQIVLNFSEAIRKMSEGELLQLADEIQDSSRGCRSCEEWLNRIETYRKRTEEQKKEAQNRDSDCVTLATLHASKGLEFTQVFLLNVNEGMIPYQRAFMEDEVEEERRLFYVGMTRAKRKLHLLWVKERYNRHMEPSRFLEPLRGVEKAVEKPGEKSGKN